jgi:hypothetical protein
MSELPFLRQREKLRPPKAWYHSTNHQTGTLRNGWLRVSTAAVTNSGVSATKVAGCPQTDSLRAPGSGMNIVDGNRGSLLLFERWIHVPVLENLFQIRPYAQVSDVIGDGGKSMRHALRDDDDVTRLDVAGRVSHHRAAAGRAV